MTKAEFIHSQVKWSQNFMTEYDKYIENEQFNNQEEEEKKHEKNINCSRHAE